MCNKVLGPNDKIKDQDGRDYLYPCGQRQGIEKSPSLIGRVHGRPDRQHRQHKCHAAYE